MTSSTRSELRWRRTTSASASAWPASRASRTHAWGVLDGLEGAATGVEAALSEAIDGIDQIYAIESTHEAHADVATPVAVEEFWERHGSLPGFAVGS